MCILYQIPSKSLATRALVVLACLAGAETVGRAETNLRITVSLSYCPQIPNGALASAAREAAKVFRWAGIEMVWMDCTLTASSGFPKDPACPKRLSPTVLFLRIVPRSREKGFSLQNSTCGIAAMPAGNGKFGSYAYVFWQRVEDLAARKAAQPDVILGHMLAHEMGHLLLGTATHSRHTIMEEDWGQEEVVSASRGRLRFTASQARRLREQVLARVRADQAGTDRQDLEDAFLGRQTFTP